MANRELTLIVVPSDQRPITRFKLPLRWPIAIAAGFALLVVALIAGALTFGTFARRVDENARLRRENVALRDEVVRQREGLDLAAAAADRVVRVERRLKQTALHADPPSLAIGPTEAPAGPAATDSEFTPRANASVVPDPAQLARRAVDDEGRLERLRDYFDDRTFVLGAIPSIWPVRGTVTSKFGGRADPFTDEAKDHAGLDIGSSIGAEVFAPADGVVIFAGPEGGYGNAIVLDHGSALKTRYGHLSAISVTLGTKVRRGQLIGRVGTTGWSTGPHLHYEVRVNGVATDPRRFILE